MNNNLKCINQVLFKFIGSTVHIVQSWHAVTEAELQTTLGH